MSEIYSVRDVKGDYFNKPFYAQNEMVAQRIVAESATLGDGSTLEKFPDDFMLFRVGTFDEARGVIEALSLPEFVASVTNIIAARVRPQVLPSVGVELEHAAADPPEQSEVK